jgi:hypothetical protein
VCSTEDEVLFAVAAHAVTSHGIAELTPPLTQAVRAATVTVG